MARPKASFEVADDLEAILAKITEPTVRKVAGDVESRARKLAPGTKRWVAELDANTCTSCATPSK